MRIAIPIFLQCPALKSPSAYEVALIPNYAFRKGYSLALIQGGFLSASGVSCIRVRFSAFNVLAMKFVGVFFGCT